MGHEHEFDVNTQVCVSCDMMRKTWKEIQFGAVCGGTTPSGIKGTPTLTLNHVKKAFQSMKTEPLLHAKATVKPISQPWLDLTPTEKKIEKEAVYGILYGMGLDKAKQIAMEKSPLFNIDFAQVEEKVMGKSIMSDILKNFGRQKCNIGQVGCGVHHNGFEKNPVHSVSAKVKLLDRETADGCNKPDVWKEMYDSAFLPKKKIPKLRAKATVKPVEESWLALEPGPDCSAKVDDLDYAELFNGLPWE